MIDTLDQWIVNIKKDLHNKYIISSDPNELENYKNSLETLFNTIEKAKGDRDLLKLTNLPDEVIDDMNDINNRTDIINTLRQAFTVFHFNRSPKHQGELIEQIGGLR
jgi:hypothetical protein